jgi:protein-L-isoaspartate(D-aspartate) O-methyltransferase
MWQETSDLTKARASMVEEQLVKRSIYDSRVLEAMAEIPRHLFVDEDLWDSAYKDGPLPIGYGQTISQPYIVAYMTQALQLLSDGQANVLEIGTGSGYQAAILSRLAFRVYSVERIPPLADKARHLLYEVLAIRNVEIRVGDGGYGWPEYAPYDGIITTAAAPEIPAPLTVQLKEGAALVLPVGPRRQQNLLRLKRRGDRIVREVLAPVAFVPLIGEHGWAGDEDFS